MSHIITECRTKILVDSKHKPLLEKFKWVLHGGYAVTYFYVRGNKTVKVPLHKMVTGFKIQLVDHANRNPLDNRSKNLRDATPFGNQWNRRTPRHNTSGYKGVSICVRKNSGGEKTFFHSYIAYKYRRRHIGTFKTAEEAALMYNFAAKRFFGKYACLNVIPKSRTPKDLTALKLMIEVFKKRFPTDRKWLSKSIPSPIHIYKPGTKQMIKFYSGVHL